MKILALVVDDISEIERPTKTVAVMLKRFGEIDPTLSVRLISLFHALEVDALADILKNDDGEILYQMLISGLAVNSLPDLMEAIYLMGFAEKHHA